MPSPLTQILGNFASDYGQRAREGASALKQDFTAPLTASEVAMMGVGPAGGRSAKILMDALNYVTSPMSSAADTVVGRPVEAMTRGKVSKQTAGNLASMFIPGPAEAKAGGEALNAAEAAASALKDINTEHRSFRQLKDLLARGGHRVEVSPPKRGVRSWSQEVAVHPVRVPKEWKVTERGEAYDPAHAYETEYGRVGVHDVESDGFAEQRQPGYIWRGMSQEEYQHALKTGQIKSRGDYNLGGAQEGLTYFSHDPAQAKSYAHSFAPWQHAGTIEHPPVILKIRDPGNGVYVPGTDPTEVGVREGVPTHMIEEVWSGRPIYSTPGSFSVGSDGWTDEVKLMGGRSPNVGVRWERVPHPLRDPPAAAPNLVAAAKRAQEPKVPAPPPEAGFRKDNPGGDWLVNTRARAEQNTSHKRPISGPITGYLHKPVPVDVEQIAKLPGAMGEHPVPGNGKYDRLMKSMGEKGYDPDNPILIGVNHRGEPYIMEGNNRTAVAKKLGIKSIPAEIRWFAGGETVPGPLHPGELPKYMVKPKP